MKINDLEPGLYLNQGAKYQRVREADFVGMLGGTVMPDTETLAENVAWVFTALNKRRNHITTIPWQWYRNGAEYDFTLLNLRDAAPRIDTAVQIRGLAYLLKQRNAGGQMIGIRWLDPATIEPDNVTIDPATGYTQYIRTNPLNGQRDTIPAGDIIRFMLPSQREIDPDTSAGLASSLAAQVLYGMGRTQDAIFDNNALPIMLVNVPTGTGEPDRQRLEGFFKRLFNWSGSNTTMRTVAVREGVTVTPISLDPDKVINTEWERSKILTILAAHDVPESYVYEASNLATRRADQQDFIGTLGGRLQFIAETLNSDPDMMRLGVTLEVMPEQHPAMARDEAENSNAFVRYLAGFTPEAAAWLVGIKRDDFPPEIQAAGIFAQLQAAQPTAPNTAIADVEDEVDDTDDDMDDMGEEKSAGWRAEAAQYQRWYKKRASPDPRQFAAKFLTHADKLALVGEPETAVQPDEMKAAFFATLAQVQDAIKMAAAAPAPTPQSFVFNLPERSVTIEPAQVSVKAEFAAGEPQPIVINVPDQPAPTVNVMMPDQPAPVVNVAIPEQPAPVVDVNVEFPKRAFEQTRVQRDPQGRIISADTTTDFEA